MLVYRNNRQLCSTADCLSALQAQVARHLSSPPDHDAVRDLLVAFDAFEGAVADACHPETDDLDPRDEVLCRTALTLAEVFLASLARRGGMVASGLRQLARELTELQRRPLPTTIRRAEAEGYAWYALFPEAYVAAVCLFLAEVRPGAVVCLGIRQIGCSLSALAAAQLAAAGCPVSRYTVRPRGAPFARTFAPAPALTAALRRQTATACYLIFDEGPGLSGSSLCCVAETLASWGIAEARIILFPGHEADASRFRSAMARLRWPRHRKITVAFDPRPQIAADTPFIDIAAGRWRELLLLPPAWPPVQPQHERSKFLFHPAGLATSTDRILAKFAGFGELGKQVQERGGRLAALGFTPPVLGRKAGFLLTRFLPGRPLTAASVDPPLLERIAAYLATLRSDFPAPAATPGEDLIAMLHCNVLAGLGESWAEHLPEPLYSEATAVDGRMLPHEWLQTPDGLIKTDALDHYADHFYPGATDIAWDLAAAEIEFRLSGAQAGFLRRRYTAWSGDTGVARRLPFYRRAWLAFRLGYTQLAAEEAGIGDEAERFRRATCIYRHRLQREIDRSRRSSRQKRH